MSLHRGVPISAVDLDRSARRPAGQRGLNVGATAQRISERVKLQFGERERPVRIPTSASVITSAPVCERDA